MPQSSVLFCGKGLGAFSAVFAGAKLARCAKGGRGNFGDVVADLPSSSVAAIMRDVVAKLFPQRATRCLVYAGARFASLFCGLGIGGRDTRRALKRISSVKKEFSPQSAVAVTRVDQGASSCASPINCHLPCRRHSAHRQP